MKCIKNVVTDKIRRVSESEARKLVLISNKGDWTWCSKKAWKQGVRYVGKKAKTAPGKTNKSPQGNQKNQKNQEELGPKPTGTKKPKVEGKRQSKYQQKQRG